MCRHVSVHLSQYVCNLFLITGMCSLHNLYVPLLKSVYVVVVRAFLFILQFKDRN